MCSHRIRCRLSVIAFMLLFAGSTPAQEFLNYKTVVQATSRFALLFTPPVRSELTLTDMQVAQLMESAKADAPLVKKIVQAGKRSRQQIGADPDLLTGAMLLLAQDLEKHALIQEAKIEKVLDDKQFKRFREIVFQHYIWLGQPDMALDYAGRGKPAGLSKQLQGLDKEIATKMQQLRLKMYIGEIQNVLPVVSSEVAGEPFSFRKKSDLKTLLEGIGKGHVR